jgi:hypothetical protein
VQPTSYIDSIAREHDIDYLTDEEPIYSDIRAILKTDNSIQGWAMRLGLTARSLADAVMHLLPFKNFTHINGRSDKLQISTPALVKMLRQKVYEDRFIKK